MCGDLRMLETNVLTFGCSSSFLCSRRLYLCEPGFLFKKQFVPSSVAFCPFSAFPSQPSPHQPTNKTQLTFLHCRSRQRSSFQGLEGGQSSILRTFPLFSFSSSYFLIVLSSHHQLITFPSAHLSRLLPPLSSSSLSFLPLPFSP